MRNLAVLTFACFVLGATSVLALSCLPANLARSFNQVNEEVGVFRLGIGTLRFSEPVPKYEEGTPKSLRARFSGRFLGSGGLGDKHRLPVRIESSCLGPWCGGFPREYESLLVFLEVLPGETYRLSSFPCGRDFWPLPDEGVLDMLQSCLRNNGCSEAQVESLERR